MVQRMLGAREKERRESELKDLPQIRPVIDELYDAEKIAVGAYSPLEGFMDSAELDSVCSKTRLTNGLPWSMPILCAPSSAEAIKTLAPLKSGDDFALLDAEGHFIAVLHLSQRYKLDKKRVAQATFATTETAHPNVADLFAAGDEAFAGKLDLVRPLDLPARETELSPLETRAEFERRGWKNVSAYQCRNPPHTAHEYLQRLTLERHDVDGLFVHPVVGRLKKGDYRPEVILRSYTELLRTYYPTDRVFLGSMSITMRYAGPKAALFLAIVRKNYGCNFYIVGRDQAGVGKYYDPYACHGIFDEFDIGITPLRYEETFFCRKCGWMATPKTCAHPAEEHVSTSQTRIREALAKHEPLPMEIIRPEIAKILSGTEKVLN